MAESKAAVTAALIGNAALAVMKGVAAASTGSAAMLAETFHSIADTGNQVLLFVGMRLSERPPDRRHGFGQRLNPVTQTSSREAAVARSRSRDASSSCTAAGSGSERLGRSGRFIFTLPIEEQSCNGG